MSHENELTESMENYLETILDLQTKNKVARARDIADSLSVKRGSVSGALKNLKEKGFINYAPYSYITLTEEGREIAEVVAYRHSILKAFLLDVLNVDDETADKNACRMEHAIDNTIVERLVCFIEFLKNSPEEYQQWLSSFSDACPIKSKDDSGKEES